MFSIFRKIVGALSSSGKSLDGVKSEIQGFSPYFKASFAFATSRVFCGFPVVTEMTQFGLNAYKVLFMPDDLSTEKLYALIAKEGFDISVGCVSGFDILRNKNGETLLVSKYSEFSGQVFVLITDGGDFLEQLCDAEITPVAPWIVFPDVDPEGLGRMEGEMGNWWENHWLPFWTVLNDEERCRYLEEKEAPAGWVEFFSFYAELNNSND